MSRQRQKAIRSAERLVGRGRLQAAIAEYRKVLQDHPNDTSTLNRVGDLYARLDRPDEAIGLFKQAARHFGREGFFVKAIAIYKKIIRLDPTQFEVYESLADLYRRQGLISEARTQYQVVADYHLKHEDLKSAAGIYRKLAELEPDNPSHSWRLADLLGRLGRPAEALSEYGSVASLMLSHGRAEEAARVYQRALETDAGDLEFVRRAVGEIRQAGLRQEARELLAAAVDLNPEARRLDAELGLLGPTAGELFEEPGAAALEPEPAPEEEPEDEVALSPELLGLTEAAAAEEATAEETGADGESAAPPVVEEEAVAEPSAGRVEGPAEATTGARRPVAEPEEFEIDLDGLESFGQAVEETEALLAEPVAEVEPGLRPGELDAGERERLDELLAEAEVLARYGLEPKAVERLEEALALDPRRLDTHRRLITLHLETRDPGRAAALADRVARLAVDLGKPEVWEQVRDQLLGEGFRVVGGRMVAPEPAAAEAAEPEPAEVAEPPVALEPLVSDAPAPPAAGELDTSWLDEAAAAAPAAGEAALFDAEEEFIDLASELEAELQREEERLGAELGPPQEEQSIEEIVEGFKKGMAETLSAEDYDTHYNLGIAYREMGLVDEAIGEFQLAAKDPRYLVDCCSLLAASFLDKGFPELAIKWYERGLEVPSITEEETLGLMYELGDLYLVLGDKEQARLRFVEIYGVNSNYRDVVAKLEELGHS